MFDKVPGAEEGQLSDNMLCSLNDDGSKIYPFYTYIFTYLSACVAIWLCGFLR